MPRRKQQWLPREGWNYALLLLLLLAIGTLALRAILDYIGTSLPEADLFPVAAALSFMLLGFMLISGAFGLYAIRFSAHAESLRRINALVNSMDYIRDPVLVVDRNFTLTGSNPAARKAFNTDGLMQRSATAALPFLKPAQVKQLQESAVPSEVEASIASPSSAGQSHTYRVRAYPSAHITILLITDITGLAGLRARQRQNSYLQLIGHIARGVATDFNDLLCGISGHATLLSRQLPADSPLMSSLNAIADCTDRGIRVSSHLIELSSHENFSQNSILPAEHVEAAVRLLRSGIDAATQVNVDVSPSLPIVGISGKQLEQTIHSLGLLTVDTLGPQVRIFVKLAPANSAPLFQTPPDSNVAAVLTIHATTGENERSNMENLVQIPKSEAGIVESVVESIIHEIDGRLESYRTDQGDMFYRVMLPVGIIPATDVDGHSELPKELVAFFSSKQLLLASSARAVDTLASMLIRSGSQPFRATDIVALLSTVEQHTDLAAIVLDKDLLGQQADSLLRAITKIRPKAGIVMLCTEDVESDTELPKGVLSLPASSSVEQLQRAVLSATSLGATREAPSEAGEQNQAEA